MTKNMKSLFLGLLLSVGCYGIARAVFPPVTPTNIGGVTQVNDPAGGITATPEIGTVFSSTGTPGSRTMFQRRIRVTNQGEQMFVQGVHFTTASAITSSTFTYVDFRVSGDTTTTAPGNPNILAIGSPTNPVYVRRVRAGDSQSVNVKLYDTRGSTDTSNGAVLFFNETLSTGASRDVDHFCSSGVAKFQVPFTAQPANNGWIFVDYEVFSGN